MDIVDEEMENVSKANILGSTVSKFSPGARIYRGLHSSIMSLFFLGEV